MALSKEAELSVTASSMFPGFRFSPTDEELIQYYLGKKVAGDEKAVEVIGELDITKFEPWDLPDKSIIKSDHEWFFFSSRGKKYPKGSQSRRATEVGYWKATGKERGVKIGSDVVGTKRTLVFHIGRAPKGERTEWIMHEYCMLGLFIYMANLDDALVICRLRHQNDFRGGTHQNQEPSTSKPPTFMASASHSESGTPSKKSNSSDESQSVEQTRKVKDEEHQLESPSRPSQSKAEDDCFADILNDNIIELDDSLTRISTMEIRVSESQSRMWEGFPSQGTANRRIRLRKQRPSSITEVSISRFMESELKQANRQNFHGRGAPWTSPGFVNLVTSSDTG
ncbi:NAC domain-containing protein [Drosera capensis]